MTDYLELADELQRASKQVMDESPLLALLSKLGKVTQTGSSVTGLMAYPDIDFAIQTPKPRIQSAIDLTPIIFSELSATTLKIVKLNLAESKNLDYYVGIDFAYNNRSWHIDATVGLPGQIVTNPPKLAGWLRAMSQKQRLIILRLKKELIDAKRYAGANSQPPYTFRSVHVYEAVLKGDVKTVEELEEYFKAVEK